MRKYKITYWAEISDECTDRDIEVQAYTISDALIAFYQKRILHKRVIEIKEI